MQTDNHLHIHIPNGRFNLKSQKKSSQVFLIFSNAFSRNRSQRICFSAQTKLIYNSNRSFFVVVVVYASIVIQLSELDARRFSFLSPVENDREKKSKKVGEEGGKNKHT